DAPPSTHAPAATPRPAVETARDDGRARRRLPESRIPLTASRRSLWRDVRSFTAVGYPHVAADAGLFHEANAPPAGPCAVAGCRSWTRRRRAPLGDRSRPPVRPDASSPISGGDPR